MSTRREMLALLIGGLLAPWEGIRRALGFENLPTFIQGDVAALREEVRPEIAKIAARRNQILRDLMYGELPDV